MLCLIWLLGCEGLDEGALGAGGTSRLRVSVSSAGPEDDAAGGCSPVCFLGMTYEVLVTTRAPVSWSLATEAEADGEGEEVPGCSGAVDTAAGCDSVGCCFPDKAAFTAASCFSRGSLGGVAASATE